MELTYLPRFRISKSWKIVPDEHYGVEKVFFGPKDGGTFLKVDQHILLGGGFKHLVCLPLFGGMIQFNVHIFQMGGSTTSLVGELYNSPRRGSLVNGSVFRLGPGFGVDVATRKLPRGGCIVGILTTSQAYNHRKSKATFMPPKNIKAFFLEKVWQIPLDSLRFGH